MGVFDFLTGGGSLKRSIAKATNKHLQSMDRFPALEALREDGSPEAVDALLRRFDFVYDKTIEDEQEKQWVHDQLLTMGDRIMPSLERHLLRAESIAWPLKVLAHIAGHDASWAVLEKIIAANDNEYVRDPSRKIQLIAFIGEEFHDPRAARGLVQYLEDMDETVRFHTVEALLHQRDEEAGREPMLKLLVNPKEESRRIKIRILDGFSEVGWNTHGFKGQAEQVCQEMGRGHSIDGKGRIRRATQKD